MKEENEAIIKALNMYGRVPEQWELLNEIERLKNKVKDVYDELNKETNRKTQNANEIIRLNNIINKAIEYIEKELDIEKICRQEKSLTICKKGLLEILDKVGSDKE